MFDIAKFAASEHLATDAWRDLVKESVGYNVDYFRTHLATLEQEWKERGCGPLPGAYRSAKSVVLSAMTLYIRVVDDQGEPLGKSAIQRAIKVAKDIATVPKNAVEQAQVLCNKLRKLVDEDPDVVEVIRDLFVEVS